ncbi:MAG: NnrS family protein [Chloroflexi bacterium]|nr:NnrS family protein [Chloroflexota bacterium]
MRPIPLRQGNPRQAQWPAQRLYRPFLVSALALALLPGFGAGAALLLLPALGIQAGIWHTILIQGHGAVQLFGWGGLFAIGLAYHVVPRFRNYRPRFPWPQRVSLVLTLLGLVTRVLGQALHGSLWGAALLAISAASLLGGAGIFVAMTATALRKGASPRGVWEPWLWTACAWCLIAALLHAGLALDMALRRSFVSTETWDSAFVHAALMGFLANEVFGVGLRTLTAFMSLPPLRPRLAWPALVLFNGGVVWTALCRLLGVGDAWIAPGAALELAGAAALVLALRVLERRAKAPTYVAGVYRRYEWFVRAAYGYLLLGAALAFLYYVGVLLDRPAFPAYRSSPILHLLTLGFLTQVIMGMAARMLPIFEGAVLPFQRLMDGAFVLLNASIALRAGFGLAGTDPATAGLAASGILGLLALALFAAVALGVLTSSARRTYQQAMAARTAHPLAGTATPAQGRGARQDGESEG